MTSSTTCPSCRASIPAGKFCISCGRRLPARLEDVRTMLRCSVCGAEVPDAKFCAKCGHQLVRVALEEPTGTLREPAEAATDEAVSSPKETDRRWEARQRLDGVIASRLDPPQQEARTPSAGAQQEDLATVASSMTRDPLVSPRARRKSTDANPPPQGQPSSFPRLQTALHWGPLPNSLRTGVATRGAPLDASVKRVAVPAIAVAVLVVLGMLLASGNRGGSTYSGASSGQQGGSAETGSSTRGGAAGTGGISGRSVSANIAVGTWDAKNDNGVPYRIVFKSDGNCRFSNFVLPEGKPCFYTVSGDTASMEAGRTITFRISGDTMSGSSLIWTRTSLSTRCESLQC